MERARCGHPAGGRRFVRELDRVRRNLEDALENLQNPAADGPGLHHRPIQPGLLGAQQLRGAARRLSAGRKKSLAVRWRSLAYRGNATVSSSWKWWSSGGWCRHPWWCWWWFRWW